MSCNDYNSVMSVLCTAFQIKCYLWVYAPFVSRSYPGPCPQPWAFGNMGCPCRQHPGAFPSPGWWCHSSGTSPSHLGHSHFPGSHSGASTGDTNTDNYSVLAAIWINIYTLTDKCRVALGKVYIISVYYTVKKWEIQILFQRGIMHSGLIFWSL